MLDSDESNESNRGGLGHLEGLGGVDEYSCGERLH